jgi:hypothetical protein
MFLNRGEGRVCDLATPTMIEVKLVEVSNERLPPVMKISVNADVTARRQAQCSSFQSR